MANRHDPRDPRTPSDDRRYDEPRPDASRAGAGHARHYDRDQDMGGSGWSGASGRGGMQFEPGPRDPRAEYPSASRSGPTRPHDDYPREGAGNVGGYVREGIFPVERGYGHVPGQRWSGGYGGEVVHGRGPHDPDAMGSGFAGSDFGPTSEELSGSRGRHFGNEVDRGGRMYGASDMGMGARFADDRGPHYGKGPKGYKRSDQRIREDVCDEIAHQGFIDASDVEVMVENGAVTLSGTVASRPEKRALEHLVERCRGVDEVHNHIRLKRATSPSSSSSPSSSASSAKQPEEGQATKDSPASTPDGHRNGKAARA